MPSHESQPRESVAADLPETSSNLDGGPELSAEQLAAKQLVAHVFRRITAVVVEPAASSPAPQDGELSAWPQSTPEQQGQETDAPMPQAELSSQHNSSQSKSTGLHLSMHM